MSRNFDSSAQYAKFRIEKLTTGVGIGAARLALSMVQLSLPESTYYKSGPESFLRCRDPPARHSVPRDFLPMSLKCGQNFNTGMLTSLLPIVRPRGVIVDLS
jgi:hypothetical protein